MAYVTKTGRAGQHHTIAPAAAVTGTEPGHEHLAVHAGQLALEPRFRLL